jgi:hypothetical protein
MAYSFDNLVPVKELVQGIMGAAIPPESQLIHDKVMRKVANAKPSALALIHNARRVRRLLDYQPLIDQQSNLP